MARDKTTFRYFILAFSAAFLVLSITFLLLMMLVHPKKDRPSPPASDTPLQTDSYLPEPQDSLTVLFMGTEQGGTAGTYILVRFNPAAGQVPVVVFPPQTMVENNGKTEPLALVYEIGGADYTRQALADTLGIPIDRYVQINLQSFIYGANLIGSIEFELERDIVLEENGLSLTLPQGKQLLDGKKVAALIRHRDDRGGELARAQLTAELTVAIINQRMDVCLSTVMDKIFEKLINLVDSDISSLDYATRKPAAEFLAKLGQQPATVVTLTGSMDADQNKYHLTDTFQARLTQYFG